MLSYRSRVSEVASHDTSFLILCYADGVVTMFLPATTTTSFNPPPSYEYSATSVVEGRGGVGQGSSNATEASSGGSGSSTTPSGGNSVVVTESKKKKRK